MAGLSNLGPPVTLSELADIGELVGGVAVVASLVYLAFQIRQNTRAVRGSTLHLNTELWANVLMRIADPSTAAAYIAGMSGNAEIKPLHYTQFYMICKSMFLAMEDQYLQAVAGTLDPDVYAAYERATSEQLLAFPGFRIWWLQTRATFTPGFVDRVETLIAATPETDIGAFLREWQQLARERSAPPAEPA
jgi:hypothetical protein